LAASVITLQGSPQSWCYPEHKPIYTVFYQGLCNSQVEAAKYVGPAGFTATTGEHIVAKYSAPLIDRISIAPEIDEITLKYQASTSKGSLFHPKHLADAVKRGLCYGIFSKAPQWWFGVKVSSSSHSMPSVRTHDINISSINCGQQQDIVSHKNKVLHCTSEHPDAELILWGVSRGAATTFDAVACNNYEKNIRLVVLEGCFESVDAVVSSWGKLLQPFAHLLLKSTAYNKNGIAPINLVDQFSMQLPEQTPVIFATSRSDGIVPSSHAQHLTSALAQADQCNGKQRKIFLIILKKSSHGFYMGSQFYLRSIHTIYYYLDLPYLPEYIDNNILKKIKRSDRICTLIE